MACSLSNGFSSPTSFEQPIFDFLRISPEDFADQITLMDLPLFKAIEPMELYSCGWLSREKTRKAPNVVNFTRRFNQINFWVQKEILFSAKGFQHRVEIITHFIKICKKLYDHRNIHATMAIVSALQSAPIYRLSKAFAALGKKERSKYDDLVELVSEENNRHRLREFMNKVQLPCIPYLGMYLTDLFYIDTAHPAGDSLLKNPLRDMHMNNIIRSISEFQRSEYPDLVPIEYIQTYLDSVRYLEELQKFVEDDNYNQSLKIEPTESSSAASCSTQSSVSSGITSLQHSGLMPLELGKKLAEAAHSATVPLLACTLCKCATIAADASGSGRDAAAETSSLASPRRTPDSHHKLLVGKFDLFGRTKRLSVSGAAHENPAANLGPELDSPEHESSPGPSVSFPLPTPTSPSSQSRTPGKQTSGTSKSGGLLNQLFRLSTRHKRNKSGSLSGPSTRSGTPAPEGSSGVAAAAAAAAAAACPCKCHQPAPVHNLRHLIDDSLIEEPMSQSLQLQRSHLHDTITEVNSSKEHSARNSESPLLDSSAHSAAVNVNTQRQSQLQSLSVTDSLSNSKPVPCNSTRHLTPERLIALTPASFFEPPASPSPPARFDENGGSNNARSSASAAPLSTSASSTVVATSTPSRNRVRTSVLEAFDNEHASDDDLYAMVSGRLDVMVPWPQLTGPPPPAIPPPVQCTSRRAPTSPARTRPPPPDVYANTNGFGLSSSDATALQQQKQPQPLRQRQHAALVATCSLTSSVSVSSSPTSPVHNLTASLPPLGPGVSLAAALGEPEPEADAEEDASGISINGSGTVVRRHAPSSLAASGGGTGMNSSSCAAGATSSSAIANGRSVLNGNVSAMSTCHVLCEGILKRKTILKEWRRPALAAWHRFWVALTSDGNLLYFVPRSMHFSPLGHKLHKRSDFDTELYKMHSIRGWIVVLFAGGKSTNVSLESSPSLAASGGVSFTRGSKSHRSRSIAASFRTPRPVRRPSASPPRSRTTDSLDAGAVSVALPVAESDAPLVACGGGAVSSASASVAAVDQPDATSFQITDPMIGNVYKFKVTGDSPRAFHWFSLLHKCASDHFTPPSSVPVLQAAAASAASKHNTLLQ